MEKGTNGGIAGLKINIFLLVCQDVRFDVNLVGHMSDKKFLKWTVQTKLFFQKNRFLNKMISKNQVNKRNVFTGKNTLFLKSINNIL